MRNCDTVVEDHRSFLLALHKTLSESRVYFSFIEKNLDHLIQRIRVGAAFFEEKDICLIQKTAQNILVIVKDRDFNLVPVPGFFKFVPKFLLVKNFTYADHRFRTCKWQIDRSQNHVKIRKFLRSGGCIGHCADLHLTVEKSFQLHTDETGCHTASAAYNDDPERLLFNEIILLDEYTEISGQMAALILCDRKVLLAFNDFRSDTGHLIGQRKFSAKLGKHYIRLMDLESKPVQHEHEMICKFLSKITGIDRNIEFVPDLRHDFFG